MEGGLYIDSPGWIKNRKTTINLINKKDNKCFQYVVTVAFNHEKEPKPFRNKYKWEGIWFPSERDYWKKNEKNNIAIALNALIAKNEKVYLAYVSKYH